MATGNGATFAISGFTGDVRSINVAAQSRGSEDDSLLSSSGFMEKVPHDLADAGTISLEVRFSVTQDLPSFGAAASATLTFPLGSGSTAATLIGTAFLTNRKYPDTENNQIMVATIEYTFDGKTGPAFTAET